MVDDAAWAAATWWAERLAPAFQDNGDQSGGGLLAGLLGGVLSSQDRPTDEQVEAFKHALARRIREKQPTDYMCIGVDYGPDAILREAAEEAEVASTVFPWKTNVWIYPDRVVAAGGYGAEGRLVWTAEDYETRPCHKQRYDHVNYNPMAGKCGQEMYHESDHDWSVPSPLCEKCGDPEDHYGYTCRVV